MLAAQRGIRAAPSFNPLSEAEKLVADALRANQVAIEAWAKSATIGGRLTLSFDAARFTGMGVIRKTGLLARMTKLSVIIQKYQQNGTIYFVLSAFPKL